MENKNGFEQTMEILKSNISRILWEKDKSMGWSSRKIGTNERHIAPFVAETLRKVQREQQENKARCGAMWNETGFVFSNAVGEPLKTHTEYKNFKTVVRKPTASFTLDVYGRVTDQMKRDSVARMEKFILSVSQ